MARYPLQPLLTVRKYREDAAQTRLRHAERILQEAHELLETKKKELDDYRQWCMEEEDRRYASIMNELLSLDDLNTFKAGLARLGEDEVLREEAVFKASQERDHAKQAVLETKEALHLAQRETARILAHKDIWIEAERKEAERKEDLESEEFKPLPVGTMGEV